MQTLVEMLDLRVKQRKLLLDLKRGGGSRAINSSGQGQFSRPDVVLFISSLVELPRNNGTFLLVLLMRKDPISLSQTHCQNQVHTVWPSSCTLLLLALGGSS